MDFKKLIEDFKKGNLKSQIANLTIICLIGVVLVIAASFFKGSNSIIPSSDKSKNDTSSTGNSDSSDTSAQAYENQQGSELTNLLQSIKGVGKVKIMMYFNSGEEQVPAYNENTSESVTNETDNSGGKRTTTQNTSGNTIVLINDGTKSEPLLIKKYKPKLTGIIIVAEGAENAQTKLEITSSVADLFDISEDKVNVFPMEK